MPARASLAMAAETARRTKARCSSQGRRARASLRSMTRTTSRPVTVPSTVSAQQPASWTTYPLRRSQTRRTDRGAKFVCSASSAVARAPYWRRASRMARSLARPRSAEREAKVPLMPPSANRSSSLSSHRPRPLAAGPSYQEKAQVKALSIAPSPSFCQANTPLGGLLERSNVLSGDGVP